MQEVYFTGISCGLYIGASTFLGTSVYNHLYYYYHTIPGFNAYPALSAVYVSFITELYKEIINTFPCSRFLVMLSVSCMAWTL
jgi:hypothetical protein